MTPLALYLWLGLAFLMGAWGYRMLEGWVHLQRDAASGIVCSRCETPAVNAMRCGRCRKHVCIDCRWFLVVPTVRDRLLPKYIRTVCEDCVTDAERDSFKPSERA